MFQDTYDKQQWESILTKNDVEQIVEQAITKPESIKNLSIALCDYILRGIDCKDVIEELEHDLRFYCDKSRIAIGILQRHGLIDEFQKECEEFFDDYK